MCVCVWGGGGGGGMYMYICVYKLLLPSDVALPQIITKALQKQSHVAVGKKPGKEGEEGSGGGEGGMPEPTHIRFSDSEHES